MSRAEFLDRVSRSTQEALMRLKVKSALNPALWLCGAVTVPSLAAAVFMYADGNKTGLALLHAQAKRQNEIFVEATR